MKNEMFWSALYPRLYDGLRNVRPYEDMILRCTKAVAGFPQNGPILDVGCGTGNLLEALVRRGMHSAYFGCDGSVGMMSRAKKKLGDAVTLTLTDFARSLPYDTGMMSAITCIQVLYAVQDPTHLLDELRRVLRPGGTLVLVNAHTLNPFWVLRSHYEMMLHDALSLNRCLKECVVLPSYLGLLGMNMYLARKAGRRELHTWSLRKTMESLESRGFILEECDGEAYGGTSCFIRARLAGAD